MSSMFGNHIKISVAGQSHAEAIGVIIDGLPAGFSVDMEALAAFLKRRAPGQNRFSTPRKEGDRPEFLSGLLENVTTGAPVMAIIRNTNTRSADYNALWDIPRPGHADLTAEIKYGGFQDVRGGGHFSGRLTAPICIAGGIALQMLREKGIEVFAHIRSIHGVESAAPDYQADLSGLRAIAAKEFPVWDDAAGEKMQAEIENARMDTDSVGGVIEVAALGLPAGLGNPMFDRMEGKMAAAAFGVPAVRGIEFGNGFGAAALYGSENNDSIYYDTDGTVKTRTNRAGGTLGGITTGMPFVYRVVIKPTPSIAKEQDSISLSGKKAAKLSVHGRHDPCIVPRAVPVMEAVTALTILDALCDSTKIWNKGENANG